MQDEERWGPDARPLSSAQPRVLSTEAWLFVLRCAWAWLCVHSCGVHFSNSIAYPHPPFLTPVLAPPHPTHLHLHDHPCLCLCLSSRPAPLLCCLMRFCCSAVLRMPLLHVLLLNGLDCVSRQFCCSQSTTKLVAITGSGIATNKMAYAVSNFKFKKRTPVLFLIILLLTISHLNTLILSTLACVS